MIKLMRQLTRPYRGSLLIILLAMLIETDEPGRAVAAEGHHRQRRIFLRDKSGRRPVYGGTEKVQTDPQWKDYILFYEYFHADNGAGLGASHQTGWTGLVAKLIELFGRLNAQVLLDAGKRAPFQEMAAD